MRKIAKKYGNTLVFQFTVEEQKTHNIKKGKIYEVNIEKYQPKKG